MVMVMKTNAFMTSACDTSLRLCPVFSHLDINLAHFLTAFRSLCKFYCIRDAFPGCLAKNQQALPHHSQSVLACVMNPQAAIVVKNPPVLDTEEVRVRSLGGEDPLEKEMATLSSVLVGESQGHKSPAGYSPWGCKGSDLTWRLNTVLHSTHHYLTYCILTS